jgi:hypothetical protein
MTQHDNGVALTSTAHPVSFWAWLRSLWWRIRPPQFNKRSLEDILIEINAEAKKSGKRMTIHTGGRQTSDEAIEVQQHSQDRR